ncbi:MAG TPA: inorganic diphosphatase [Dongiaceae bacterium]|nr:inorganic diphosphatase [Dongiaceae bacterium]
MAKSGNGKKNGGGPGRVPAFANKGKGIVNAVIETPSGSRNKFKFDEKPGMFALSKVLPEGMVFPHAFGFVPNTEADDGDPEDVLVIMDEPTFSGCVVPARLVGVMEAEQTEDGESERNDRLIAIAAQSRQYEKVKDLRDLNGNVIKEIEKFFVNYNEQAGKKFRVLQMRGPKQARRVLEKNLQ